MSITRASTEDIDPLGALIAEAFTDLPPSRWLVPHPPFWGGIAGPYFAMFVGHALSGGGAVYTTEDRAAVAVWLFSPPHITGYEERLRLICGEYTPRFVAFDEAMERVAPSDPHHHLAFLAVHPARQRTGLGSALLREHHAYLDAHGVPGYLEAASPALRPYYAGHGYQALDTAVAVDGVPLMYPMWRP